MIRCRVDQDVELRPLESAHADELFSLIEENRDYLRQWLVWVDANTTARHTEEFIRSSDGRLACGIWYRGDLVGVIGCQSTAWSESTGRIGYWLAESLQGRGIVTRACRALIEYAFTSLGMGRAEIFCVAANRKSCAIPERLGFLEEGTIRDGERLHDRFVDLVVYGMLCSDWRDAGGQPK